ncbi:WD40 repeat domain-containing protein [Calothrix sp. PCC 6303]|uniref:WD40 repeat domain-containing protein n=1 Tax=Calothrix sp. PCC 6303 TaxID=1170562 RepID=UPI0002A044F2|nr:WD40 repeat domain-containing protein [Calothrix sp. PCC 6303]AFZ01496.1 WD40 repeat-containing protein [Calothrix sp. PCC 6303]
MKITLRITLILFLINFIFLPAKATAVVKARSTNIAIKNTHNNSQIAADPTSKKSILKPMTLLSGHSGGTAWNLDGKTLASASANNRTIQIWDTEKGHLIKILAASKNDIKNDEIKALAWSIDGKKLAATISDRIFIWNVNTGRLINTFKAVESLTPYKPIRAIAWNADNQTLAVLEETTIKLWNTTTGKLNATIANQFFRSSTANPIPINMVPQPPQIRSFAWSPDGKTIVSVAGSNAGCGSENTITLWDKTTGKRIKTIPGHYREPIVLCASAGASNALLSPIAWSQDGKFMTTVSFMTIGSGIELWDMTTHKFVKTLGEDSPIIDFSWYANSQTLVSLDRNQTIKFWDISTGKAIATFAIDLANITHILDVSWSHDGKKIASGKFSKDIKIWNIPSF